MRGLPRWKTLVLSFAIALPLAAAVPGVAQASQDVGPAFLYEGPGTVVTGLDDQGSASTVTDSGGVVCEDADGDGAPDRGRGGTCIPFQAFFDGWNDPLKAVEPRGNAIHVSDKEVADDALAFQICVDFDGSRSCGGPTEAESPTCRDLIQYSHETDTGDNFNPLHVSAKEIPSLWDECGDNGGFPGFVVITCAGLHAHADDQGDGEPQVTHTHQVTQGTAQPAVTEDFGQGDFCGAGPPTDIGDDPLEPSREKPYLIE